MPNGDRFQSHRAEELKNSASMAIRADERRQQSYTCSSCNSQHLWGLFLLWMCLSGLLDKATAACGAVTYDPCPDALTAARAMTANNAQLPITNAAFTGVCTPEVGYLQINNMGCHELAPLMPLGECCQQLAFHSCMLIAVNHHLCDRLQRRQ